jgi:hypothetical protein
MIDTSRSLILILTGGCTQDIPFPEAQRPTILPIEAAIIIALDFVE